MEKVTPRVFHGWRGFLAYLKSFSKKEAQKQIQVTKEETLLLYRDIHKLIRENCRRYAIRESKKSEFRYYFKESRDLEDPQDYFYFLNTMKHVKQRLENKEYPPFPRRLPWILTSHQEKDRFFFRKYIWNLDKDDIILEPGQDPVRQPFIDPRQFHSDIVDDPRYFKNVTVGTQFPEEQVLFEEK